MTKSLLLVAVAFACTSCSVVDKNKLDGFATLAVWKDSADSVQRKQSPHRKDAYTDAAKAVDLAIAGTQQEVAAVGNAWLPISQVDGSLNAIKAKNPNLEGKVASALKPEPEQGPSIAADPLSGATAVIIKELAEYLRKQAVEGRKTEAKALSERLESYKWKSW